MQGEVSAPGQVLRWSKITATWVLLIGGQISDLPAARYCGGAVGVPGQ